MLQMKKIVAILLIYSSLTGVHAQVKKGQPAPDIKLPGKSDEMFALSSFKGNVVLLDFWASWCAPCRRNNPDLVKLYEMFHDKGFEIFGVSIDTKKSEWLKAISQDVLTWPQVLDTDGWNAQSTLVYGVDGIPASYLIDRKGIIRGINLHGRELEAMLKKLLK
jgi:peroxiredoxin